MQTAHLRSQFRVCMGVLLWFLRVCARACLSLTETLSFSTHAIGYCYSVLLALSLCEGSRPPFSCHRCAAHAVLSPGPRYAHHVHRVTLAPRIRELALIHKDCVDKFAAHIRKHCKLVCAEHLLPCQAHLLSCCRARVCLVLQAHLRLC